MSWLEPFHPLFRYFILVCLALGVTLILLGLFDLFFGWTDEQERWQLEREKRRRAELTQDMVAEWKERHPETPPPPSVPSPSSWPPPAA